MLNKLDKSMKNLFLSQRNNSSYIRTGLGTRTGLGSVFRYSLVIGRLLLITGIYH